MYRFFDLVIAIPLFILLLPLFLIVSLLLLITGEHLVIYRQSRIGRFGREFDIVKFVTMLKNSPNLGSGTLTVEKDDRVLPVGRFLRSSKINELPQIYNVLRGDMSLVGHRPLVQREYDAYDNETKKIIDKVRPGVTGIASLVLRNENSIYPDPENSRAVVHFYNNEIAPYKAALEVWYASNRSLRNYFKIIFLTAGVVILNKPQLVKIIFKDLPVASPRLNNLLNLH